MNLNNLLNPIADGSAAAQAPAKTPQRTVSLAQPPSHNSYSPTIPPGGLPRTSSLPAQSLAHRRRESSESVSPKTMPPQAPVPFHITPSPTMSRKRSLSTSDRQHTPQPARKRPRYSTPPPWARRERDGFHFEPSMTNEPPAQVTPNGHRPRTATSATPNSNHQQLGMPPLHPAPPSREMSMQSHTNGTHSEFEPSLDNREPYNDMERAVCDFLFQNVILGQWQDLRPGTKIEIEAKLGRITDPHGANDRTGRLAMPSLTEFVLPPNYSTQFESVISIAHHANLNKYLNSTVQAALHPSRKRIDYKHLRETDLFYDIPASAIPHLDPMVLHIHQQSGRKGGPRLRVTMDDATQQVKAVIVKTKLRDMEIRCPNDEFDFRVSIALETEWRGDWQQFPEHLDKGVRTTRKKDRLSYKHQGFQVDLTQVTPVSAGPKDKIHELEIEMDVDRLFEEGGKNLREEPNCYTELIHVFLNNVKVINRAARMMPS